MKAIFLVSLVLITYGVQMVLSDSENGSSLPDLTSNGWALGVCTVAVIIFGWLWCRFTDEPTVEIENRYYTVKVGQQAELRCSVLGAFPFIKSVTWEHTSPGGRPVQLDLDLPEYTRSKPDHLIINKTVKSDEGEYVCTVSSWYGKRRSTTTKLTLIEASTPSCVYKPATTAKYPSTKETTNYARICRLVVDVIPDVFRQLLIARLPVSGIASVLTSQRGKIFKLLNNQQKKIIYPPGGMFQGTAKDFDIPLLYILLRNLGNIQPHRKGWGQVPDKADRSLSANIERLRIQRNEAYGHAKSASLSDVDFQANWTDIRQSIEDLQNGCHITGTFVADVNIIETMRMDPSTDSNFLALVKEMEGEIGDIKDQITKDREKLRGTVAAVNEDVNAVKEDVSAMKQSSSTNGGRNPKLRAVIETTRLTTDVQTLKPEVISIQALEDAKEMIRKNNIVLIKGASGDGKTLMGYQLLKWLMDGDNKDTRLSKDPVQLYSMAKWDKIVEPNTQLAVYIDDVSGEIAEDLKKREISIKSTFRGKLNNRSNCLILNVRDEIFKSTQLHSCELFNQKTIDLRGKNCIKTTEKQRILESYVPEIKNLSDGKESEIIKLAPDIGFPQCCHLFKYVPGLKKQGINFFKQPFLFMKTTLNNLPKKHFSALLFLFLNDGTVKKGDLDPKNSESVDKKKLDEAFQGNQLDHADKIRSLRESLEMFEYLVAKRKYHPFYDDNYDDDDDDDDDSIYKFCHDSVQDTVALLYGKNTKIGFIENCPRKFLHYISTSKSTANKIVISSSSKDKYKRLVRKCMYERLARECKSDVRQDRDELYKLLFTVCESDAHRLSDCIVRLDVWTDTLFLRGFFSLLSGQKDDNNLCHLIKCALLNGACSIGLEDCVSCLLSVGVTPDNDTPFCVVEGGSVQLLRQLLKYDVIPTARARRSRSSHDYAGNINVLHEVCLFEREEMVTMLYNKYPQLVHETDKWRQSTLHFVARTGNCGIFQTVERMVLKSLCRVENVQHKCESEDGRVVHRSCACGQYMSQLVDKSRWTVLHCSCWMGHRELSLYLCKLYPALTTAVGNGRQTILHCICISGHRELSLELCKLYPALTAAVTNKGQTILHCSCERGHRELSLELCKLYPALITAIDNDGWTILHCSCERGFRELSLELCKLYPALTTAVDNRGYHCLHHIARKTSDVYWFTECERHVKQYVETTGGKYDITTIITNDEESILDLAKIRASMMRGLWKLDNPLYDHLVKVFPKKETNIYTSVH
ncbi:uncharacterized protein LOC117320960 [Pecten maximus]|uniref:uncharacterized protein LOC117320960 n=1 Tax=Pecten maximus TaxID=6579 RepID=UPI0014589B73|nr:uncharacterized protein LOC117320960 [Pecten maximus]